MKIYIYENVFSSSEYRPMRSNEEAIILLREGKIPFCDECGTVIVNPAIHQQWHNNQELQHTQDHGKLGGS